MPHRPRSEAELRAHIASVPMDGDISARRDGFARLAGPQPPAEALTLGDVPCRAIGTGPALLWLHGGGYVFGSAQTHLMLAATLARAGLRVILPDYRLAPEHPWPAMLHDALAVLDALGPARSGRRQRGRASGACRRAATALPWSGADLAQHRPHRAQHHAATGQ